MLKRCLLILLSITAATTPAQETKAQETKPQELKGKEASEFLTMASAQIEANCDAIKSWKGKIEAQHAMPIMANTGAVTIDTTFAIATNGDLLVHLDKMSGQTMLPRDASGILGLREPHKPHSFELFLHGEWWIAPHFTYQRNRHCHAESPRNSEKRNSKTIFPRHF